MSAAVRPEFIRLPTGRAPCPYTGMKRGVMRMLTVPSAANDHRPPVPAKCVRSRGNLRGTWYVPYDRLVAYMDAQPTPGLAEEPKREPRPAGGFPGAKV